MTFKEFKTIQLQRIKVRLWFWCLKLETLWAKHFGKRFDSGEDLIDYLDKK